MSKLRLFKLAQSAQNLEEQQQALIESFEEGGEEPQYNNPNLQESEETKQEWSPVFLRQEEKAEQSNRALYIAVWKAVQHNKLLTKKQLKKLQYNHDLRDIIGKSTKAQKHFVDNYVKGRYDWIDATWPLVKQNPIARQRVVDLMVNECTGIVYSLDYSWPEVRKFVGEHRKEIFEGMKSWKPSESSFGAPALIDKKRGAIAYPAAAFYLASHSDCENVEQYLKIYLDEGSEVAKGEMSFEELHDKLSNANQSRATLSLQRMIFDLYGSGLIKRIGNFDAEEIRILKFVEDESARILKQYLVPNLKREVLDEALTTAIPETINYSGYNNPQFVQEKLSKFYNKNGQFNLGGIVLEELARMRKQITNKKELREFDDEVEEAKDYYASIEEYGMFGEGGPGYETAVPNIAIEAISNVITMEDAMYFFALPEWDEDYGGPLWAKIAMYTLELERATTTSSIAFVVDKLMHLVHNTGSIFNKASFQALATQYAVIIEAKANPQSMRLMYPYMSRELQELVSPYLRSKRVSNEWIRLEKLGVVGSLRSFN